METPVSSPLEKPKHPFLLSPLSNRYVINHLIGQGSFGDIFEGYDKQKKILVALKVEKRNIAYSQLEYESKVYHLLHQAPLDITDILPYNEDSAVGCLDGYDLDSALRFRAPAKKRRFIAVGIPAVYGFVGAQESNVMVMELCGPSLEDLFNYCHRRFSLKTVLMLAEQILHRLEYLHERGLMHRDIKTDNFVLGRARKAHVVHLIDFGLAKPYWDSRRQAHIAFVDGKPLTGTARYCSVNAHRGYELSRRDDLESVGYVLVYLLKGALPWQGLQDQDRHFKSIKIGEKKIATSAEELCRGLPTALLEYCRYCRRLSFQERPDYRYLRGLFRGLARRMGYLLPAADEGEKVDHPLAVPSPARTPTGGLGGSRSPPPNRGEPSAAPTVLAWDPSRGSSGFAFPRMLNAPEVAAGKESRPWADDDDDAVNPQRGLYDWMFDWMDKRQREIRRGKVVNFS